MPMKIECAWEHNGNDTLLYAINFPGAYTRGKDLDTAAAKIEAEVASYLTWREAMANNGHYEKCCAAFCGMIGFMEKPCIGWQ